MEEPHFRTVAEKESNKVMIEMVFQLFKNCFIQLLTHYKQKVFYCILTYNISPLVAAFLIVFK